MSSPYPFLSKISQKSGVTEEQALSIFKLENDFHNAITQEEDFDKRQKLYEEVYLSVGKFFNTDEEAYFKKLIEVKSKIVRQFRKELLGKKLLDVGCGNGSFLYALAQSNTPMEALYGLDVKAPLFPKDEFGAKINCYQRNIIRFELPEQFDVLMLDNVYEHIAPQDKLYFLESMRNTCRPDGKIIMIVPHRMFGPTDFSTIIDDTRSGKIKAQCVHLNETTFGELIEDLKSIGFSTFRTTIPFITLTPLRNWLPDLRLPASWFVALERSTTLIRWLQGIKFRGKCLFRMEVILIATV
ncbi:MAG: class I SAM-dependent methyltransferase [Runella sp.]